VYKSELDKHIQNQTLSNNFILFGESSFLIDFYTQKLSNIEDSSALTFYHDEYDFQTAKAHLSQASLFGDRSVLILKSEKKIPKNELEIFIDLCEKNKENIFIYAYYGTDHKTYTKAFAKKSTMAVRFFHPKDFEAQNIILALAHYEGVVIDKYEIAHLLALHNGDVALACNEIEKFKILGRPITTKDIDALVFGLGEINIDTLIKKILLNKEFKEDLHKLLEHGEDEIRLLTTITSYLTQLYLFNIYIRVNGAPNALEILGYPAPKFVVDEKAGLAIKIKPQTYYKIHELLLSSELKMKSSNLDKEAILYSTLIRTQKLLA